MTWLIAQSTKARCWTIKTGTSCPDDAQQIMLNLANGEERATELVGRVTNQISGLIWRLEFAAAAYVDERAPIAAGLQLADHILADGGQGHTKFAMEIPASYPVAATNFAARAALWRQGSGPRPWLAQCRLAVLGWLCAIAAPIVLLALLLRHGGASPNSLRRDGNANCVPALHGEDSNRTRHIRRHLQAGAGHVGAKEPLLLLGRPRKSVMAAFAALDADDKLQSYLPIRPLDFRSVLTAFFTTPHNLWSAGKAVLEAGFLPSRRELLSITYRFAQGTAHRNWWKRTGGSSSLKTVIFGHTGTADTSMLETAMQEDGIKTVHAAHGTFIGWSFAGISDVGLFQSRYDAAQAAGLPQYRSTKHFPLEMPQIQGGNGDWLLLSSYTHPLTWAYMQGGARADCELVEWVAGAARKLGHPPEKIIWRPHPLFAQTAPDQIAMLHDRVDAAGFKRWPDGAPYSDLAQYLVIITSPSTTMLDCLRFGKLPIVAAPAPLQQDLVYAAYPLLARSAAETIEAISTSLEPQQLQEIFTRAWRDVGPGSIPDLPTIARQLSD